MSFADKLFSYLSFSFSYDNIYIQYYFTIFIVGLHVVLNELITPMRKYCDENDSLSTDWILKLQEKFRDRVLKLIFMQTWCS